MDRIKQIGGTDLQQNYNKYHQKNNGKKRIRLTMAAFLLCIIASAGMFCKYKEIGPFAVTETFGKNVHDTRTKKQAQADFEKLLREIFIEEVTCDSITLNYTLKEPEKYDIEKTEPSLGEYTIEEMKNSLLVSENRLATLETYDIEKLTDEQQLIYEIIYEMSKQNLEAADLLEYSSSLGPTTGIQAQLPVYFAEYNFYEKEDIDTYIKLLKLVPKYFEQILTFEKNKSKKGLFMSDVTAQAIIDQCTAFVKGSEENYLITLFPDKLKQVDGISEKERDNYIKNNKEAVEKSVIPAYESLIAGLKKLKGSAKNQKGLCYFEKGKEYYEYLVKARTGSGRSIEDINALLDNRISELKKDMADILAETPEVYYDAQNVKYEYDTPQKAMEHLKSVMEEDFPALDSSITCEIKKVDESLEEYMSPAFYMTPAIDNFQKNAVYINENKKYDLSKSFTTIGHESYPGHLYQMCYFNSQNPNPVRSIINVTGYTEGWATYAELFCYDYAGLDEKTAQLLKYNTLTTLCIYAKADLGVNYSGWNYDKLESYLLDFGFGKENIRTIYNSMIAEPTGYMVYTLGYLEIESLLTEAKAKLGKDFELKQFHRFILQTGPAPFSIIEKRMQEWLS